MAEVSDSFPKSVDSQIAFLNDEWRHRDTVPRIYSRQSRHANTSRHDVSIHNGRIRHEAGDLDLDGSGFVLVDHESAVTDFRNKEVVLQQYFPEMRELILELTGAHDAFSFPFYQVRSREPEHFFDAYSLYMHCDYSPDTWSRFAQSIIRNSGREQHYPSSEWDFAWYNLWRPVGHTVEKDPLVVMDASTVDRDDIVNYQAAKEEVKAQAALPLFNEDQRYYYIPGMRTNEVLVLKQLDSRADKALVCPHTSFADPTAPADAQDRESIDIRFMCVFPK
jgi:hypothetical protein